MVPTRSEGSRLLSKLNPTQGEIAAEIGVGQSIVAQWIGGTKRPGAANRDEMFRLYAIPQDAWDREPGQARPDAPAKASRSEGGPVDPERETREQIARLRVLLTEPGMTTREQLAVESNLGEALKTLARLSGGEITEAKILKSPAWRRLEQHIARTLTPWPAALAALGASLEKLGGE